VKSGRIRAYIERRTYGEQVIPYSIMRKSLLISLYLLLVLTYSLAQTSNIADAPIAQSQPVEQSQNLHGPNAIAKFHIEASGPEIINEVRPNNFFDVVGRQAAIFGREDGTLEAWAYPLKLIDNFRVTFNLQGYPVEIPASQVAATIQVRPEATTITYAHAAFTVREIIFAPIDRPGAIILFDIDSYLPLQITCSFRPDLRLMWPAGLGSADIEFDAQTGAYTISDAAQKLAAVIGSPGARDLSLQPYQEEPRYLPTRFQIDTTGIQLNDYFVPICIAGAPQGGPEAARRLYREMLTSAADLYNRTVLHYRRVNNELLQVQTPDQHLNQAFAWAKVAIDKGFVVNPYVGSGLIGGFRTSGASERPGFGWFFGRDALWTMLAINSYGDFDITREALRLLGKYQRADGKIMHELSQSATFVNWFSDYPYPYASADSTPLYIIAMADYYRMSGDLPFIQESWQSIHKAYEFSLSTDRDGDGLIENTGVGHGWVEGGRLYPAHQEIYLEGLWVQALRSMSYLARLMRDEQLSRRCAAQAGQALRRMEDFYWKSQQRIYAFSKQQNGSTINEVTVMPAVPMWWRLLDETRAAEMLSHIASAEISTDWGARILSNRSALYDPLSYHYGSVWPLFTGWAAMAEYSYRRPHAGFALLMSNAYLTYDDALGYITELLSGDRYKSFGRSSHHQIWSSAMLISPLVRGLLGLDGDIASNRLNFAPQLPADWDSVEIRSYRLGKGLFDFKLSRQEGKMIFDIVRRDGREPLELALAPSFPLDAKILEVIHNGKPTQFRIQSGREDQQCVIMLSPVDNHAVEIRYAPGIEVSAPTSAPVVGERTRGLKILSTELKGNRYSINVEGLSGESYELRVYTSRSIARVDNATLSGKRGKAQIIQFAVPATKPSTYIRRTITVELGK